MKRLILAATAASLLFGTAAMAAPYQDHRNYDARNYDVHGSYARVDYRGHEFRRGQYLPAQWRYGPALDYQRYHLRQPPRGYYWVRAHNDYVLVARSNGLILDLGFSR